ncbi:MAG TPA: hypothetical protein VFV10_04550 [Gammaproteobacteria bacterium]|nr:hypothetical protein [Gammaproteobacteria bacterium]
MLVALGIDHSLTAFGVTAVRSDWELDFTRVVRATWETKPGLPAPARRAQLTASLVHFVRRLDIAPSDIRAAIEGGIFMRGKADSIRSQERLAGVVEDALWKLGIELAIAEQRAVRSVFMGRSASFGRGAGAIAQAMLGEVAPVTRTWFEAELDAFLVSNYALAEAGEAFISCAPAIEPGRPRRGRKVA